MLTCTPVLVQAVKQTIKLSLIWDTMMFVWCYYTEFRMYNPKLSYSSVAKFIDLRRDLNEILGK